MTELTRLPDREELDCIICERPGPGVDMAHIEPRSLAPDKIDDPDNKVPLCRRCHENIDKLKVWAHRRIGEVGTYTYIVVEIETGELIREVRNLVVSERHGCLVRRVGGSALLSIGTPEVAPSQQDSFYLLREVELPALSEGELADLFFKFDGWEALSFLAKCEALYGLRERHKKFGEEQWRKRAGEIVGRKPSTCYLYSEVWAMLLELQSVGDAFAFDEVLRLKGGTLQVLAQVKQELRYPATLHLLDFVANAKDKEVGPAAARKILREGGFLPATEDGVTRYTLDELERLWEEADSPIRVTHFFHYLREKEKGETTEPQSA